jgi:hypothetical protein
MKTLSIIIALAALVLSCTEQEAQVSKPLLPPLDEWIQFTQEPETPWDITSAPTTTPPGGEENSLAARSSYELMAAIIHPYIGVYTILVTVKGSDSSFITLSLCRANGSAINTKFFNDVPVDGGLKHFPITLTSCSEVPAQIRVTVTSTSASYEPNKITLSEVKIGSVN